MRSLTKLSEEERAARTLTRFMEKVRVTDGCWEWLGHKDKEGYGQFSVGSRTDNSRRTVLAHKFHYELLNGPIPSGFELDHTCRNRGCVRPDHLEVVTPKVNIQRGETGKWQGKRTHCPQGHLFDEANTYRPPSGRGRYCRICNREYSRRYRENKKKKEVTNGKENIRV